MQRVSAVPVLAAVAAISLLTLLPGCGGNNNATNIVTQVVVTPSTASLNQGGVATLSAIPEDSTGAAVAADITFSSSNSNIAAVSPGGLVCGGSWDAAFVNCTPKLGPGGVGQITITATATVSGKTATALVYVHEQVDQVKVIVEKNCTSMGQQVKLYAQVLSTTAPGCSTSAPCDITSTVGPIAFGTNNSGIVSATSAGQLMAGTPGATTIFARVSGVNSVGTPYMTCPVATILIHDASSSNTSFSIGAGGTQPLTADVYDTNNQYIKPTLTWGSSSTAVATVAATGSAPNPGTITGVAPGTAYITATCSYPNCNLLLPAQYSQNVVKATVGGGTSTTVYAASTNSTMLVPFPIGTDVPGTAITLPYKPNSIIAGPAGAKIYLGSTTALMVYTVSAGAVTTFSGPWSHPGDLSRRDSPAGFGYGRRQPELLQSLDGRNNRSRARHSNLRRLYTGQRLQRVGYGPDLWLRKSERNLGHHNLGKTANALDIMAQGGLTYITSAAAQQVYVYSTCNQTPVKDQAVLSATNPTLIKALPNGTGAAAADSPNVDLISTPSTLTAGCPVTTLSTITPYDLGAGDFTATQMFISPDSSRVWILSNLPQVLNFNLAELVPNNVQLPKGTIPLYGGMTLDSAHAYIGTSDGTVHRIDTKTMTDVAQIAVGLKDSSGKVTPPNLISVLP